MRIVDLGIDDEGLVIRWYVAASKLPEVVIKQIAKTLYHYLEDYCNLGADESDCFKQEKLNP